LKANLSATDSKLAAQADHIGQYSNTSLRPVTSYVQRPALHNIIEEQLHDTLTELNHTAKILVVWGLGGAGKSQLVLNYVDTYRKDYSGVFWIEAGQKASLERDYSQIYNLLFGNHPLPGQERVTLEEAIQAVKAWFHGRTGKWLVVLDSADSIDNEEDESYIDIQAYFPNAPSVDVILTTRSSTAKEMTGLKAVGVAELEVAEAVELFCRCSKLQRPQEQEVLAIVKELGCLALAISLAGAYVAATPRLKADIRQYLPEYQERRKILLSQKPKRHIHQYRESVLTTWESSFVAVSKESPEASRLLSLLAFLGPDDILIALFNTMEDRQNSHADMSSITTLDWQSTLFPGGPCDRYTFEAVFRTLETYSLIQWRNTQESYYMHKLVHAWAYDRLEADDQSIFSVIALRLLVEVSSSSKLDHTLKSRLVPHIITSFKLSTRTYALAGTRRGEILDLLVDLGNFLHSLGLWLAESQIWAFHFAEQDQLLGQEHPSTLTSMANLASTYRNQGRWKEAEGIEVQVMEITKRVLGAEHPDTLGSSMSLNSWTHATI
jgi:hypothetical protein